MGQPLGVATAMDYVIRAHALTQTEDDTVQRRREQIKLYEEALRRDPNLVPALVGLSQALFYEYWVDVHVDRERALRRIDDVTSRAVSLDPTHPVPWLDRARSLYYMGQWEAALEANAKAIQLDPDDGDIVADRGWLMSYLGRPKEALVLVEQAIVMHPQGEVFFFWTACFAHLLLGQYELAIADCEKAKGLSGFDVWAEVVLVAAYAQHGEMTKAASAKAEVLRLFPEWTIATLWTSDPHLHPEVRRLADEQFHSGLRKAGFPEK